jgi:hypothetical protein
VRAHRCYRQTSASRQLEAGTVESNNARVASAAMRSASLAATLFRGHKQVSKEEDE